MAEKDAFLLLVRFGIGHQVSAHLANVDWSAVQDLASKQGLSAIVLDGIEELKKCSSNVKPPEKMMLTKWIGEVLQGYEYRYELYRRSIAELAGFYNDKGYKMMVLKGYACSLNWPKPEHRPCGDIDIWQFGMQKEADTVLAKEKGIGIDSGRHHHTVFYWRNFLVENHYDFVNVHSRRSSAELEKVFKELGKDDSHFVEVYGEKVYLPSPNLHALFLVRHALNHFASIGINLRQVLDWAFFAEKHSREIDWKWLNKVLEQYHMNDFFNCLNGICVEDLGFNISIFHDVQFKPSLKERVLYDIINPEFQAEEPQKLLPRLVYKYRRWKGNAWKQELCYKESRWSAFWSNVWTKILKPTTI